MKASRPGYCRWLSDGKWRLEVFFRCLFDLIVRTFRISSLVLVLDDTLSPKWGRSIFGTGFHFDHTARPAAHVPEVTPKPLPAFTPESRRSRKP